MTTALLEREAELAALVELCRDAGRGQGALLVVEAPPGLGKSTLLEHLAEIARGEGLLMLRARGHELERSFAWGVARSLFEATLATRAEAERDELLAGPGTPARAVFGASDDAGGPPASEVGFAILHALFWLTVRLAERAPLLLVVDDVQWADEPSLRFLLYLLGRLSDAPMAVVVAVRSGERGERGLVELLAGDPAARVRVLAPLGAAAVTELVRRRRAAADEGFCRRCFALTGGNPLLLRELLVAIAQQEGPADAASLATGAELAARSLARSVLRRLAALPAEARALARAVAVFEDEVPLHLAAALATLGPEAALAAVDELGRADVLRAGDPLAFTHPLLRAAIYGELSHYERAETHRRAARLLAEGGASSERVSAHLLESAPAGDEVVVGTLREAARRALAQGAPESAVHYLERALREPPSASARPGLLAELGRAEATAGRPETVPHFEAAIELAGERRERDALRLEFGRVLHDVGRLGDACAAFRRGLDELDADGGELAVDLEAGYLTSAMLFPPCVADAHRRVDAILTRSDRLASRAKRTLTSKAMLMRLWGGGRRDELLALARRLFADGRLVEEGGADSQALWHVIGTLSWCDDYATAEDALRLAQTEVRRRGWVIWIAGVSQLRARQRLWTGPVADAVEEARAAVEIFSGGRQLYLPASAYCLARGLLEQDEPEQAEAVLGLVDRLAPSSFFAAWRHEAGGRLAAHRGDHARALEAFLAQGQSATDTLMLNPTVFPWRSEAGLAADRLGQRDLARTLIEQELALAERFGGPRAIGVARRAAGLLARGEAAVELLRAATDGLAGCGARVEHARALADLGAAIRRAGRPAEARETLRHALALAEPLGARSLARRVREELQLAGGRAPPHDRRQPGDLTPSERRVAELAAAGHTNREIANDLFITVKAVEWHLGNVYRKLDIRGRTELTERLGGARDAAV